MEIILLQDIPKVGYKGDVVKVKQGFARNFLFPQKMAKIANESNLKVHQENMRQASHKLEKERKELENMARELENLTIEIAVPTGISGKIFGSVTTLQVARSLKELGFDVDRRRISFNEEIKTLGSFKASVDIHKEVKAQITLNIVAGKST